MKVLKPEPKHYLLSATYTVSGSQGIRAGPSLVCRNISFSVKCKISPQSGLGFCSLPKGRIYH